MAAPPIHLLPAICSNREFLFLLMSALSSIRLLMPYFGRWPFWMPLFLESCRHNPDIEWLFYTDCEPLADLPPNVTMRSISFAEYCRQASERLGLSFQPAHPYKLCDIRPAYGLIHAEDVEGIDFWGWGDIDVIYGNLREYYTPSRLAGHDLFSTHARRVSGHLCLVRNTPRMREAFRHIRDWQSLFTDPTHRAVDEKAFSKLFIRHKNFPAPLHRLAGSFNPWRRRSEFIEAYSTPLGRIAWTDGSRNFPTRWFWKQGVLTNDRDGDRRFPYFHFVVWKKEDWTLQPEPEAETMTALARENGWTVTAKGFQGLNA